MTNFTNTDSTIDSRDIIERIEELENELKADYENIETAATFEEWIEDMNGNSLNEYCILKALAEECSSLSADWEYGETLIHRDYFEEYMDEMIDDCYTLPKDLPYWMSIKLDYDALEQDYTSIYFDGQEYLIRYC